MLRAFLLTCLLCCTCCSAVSGQVHHWEIALSPHDGWQTLQRHESEDSLRLGRGDLEMKASFSLSDPSAVSQAILTFRENIHLLQVKLNGKVMLEGDAEAAQYQAAMSTLPAHDEVLMYPVGRAYRYVLPMDRWQKAAHDGANELSIMLQGQSLPLAWLHLGIQGSQRLFDPKAAKTQTVITSSNLPLVFIDTHGQTIDDLTKIVADMGIVDNPVGVRNNVTDPFNGYNGRISIEVRGSTSQQYPKKSYGFETQTATGANNNVPLLGLPSENDWILYAPYPDKTLMRNTLAYHLFNQMQHYSPKTRLCELIINQQYVGVYELHERVKIDKNRLDLPKMDIDDLAGDSLTGGYIVKIDKQNGTIGPGWDSPLNANVHFQYHDPEEAELDPVQRNYVRNFVSDFENVLNSSQFSDPVNGYRRYIDVESFMDFMIMQEVGRTVDGYRSSCFLHKQRDSYGGKLSAGPMWDFNLSYGNADYCDAYLSTGYQYDFNSICPGFYPEVPFWWARLMQDQRWQRELRCRWDFLRAGPLSIPTIHGWIDSMAVVLDESKTRNFDQWPILGTYVNWNYFVGNTYAEEITYLKTWIADRITWLDANFPGAPPTCSSVGASDIQLTEVNYNAASIAPSNDWFELHNAGTSAVDLTGWRMKDSNPDNLFSFPAATSIPPGGYLVVCTDTAAFHAQHPNVNPIVGPIHFDLGNGGDAIRIFDSYYTEQLTMRFDDTLPWVTSPDGGGYTLEILSPNGNLSDPANWFAGCLGGSPGGPYVTPCAVGLPNALSDFGLQAFPNPFADQLSVAMQGSPEGSMELTLFELTGRVVAHATLPADTRGTLNTSALPAGAYLLLVKSGEWTVVKQVHLMR